MKREKIRQQLLDHGRGKDVLMLGPLGNYESYRKDGMIKWWDFAYLKTIASSLVGIDINRELISVASEDGYPVIYGDAENFAGSYDLIYAPDLIEHLGNPLRCLECCAAAVRPGGLIVMETPNPNGINYLLKALVAGSASAINPEHTCWIDAKNIEELARRAGLHVEVSTYTPLNPYGKMMFLRTVVYKALTWLRPMLGAKLVFVFQS
jgi:2-polyprenyl-3-methyl-5-hydroxy-6-metoxy-1,4-benzoquinol methylase